MPRLFICPCCGAETAGRMTPITPSDAQAAYQRMLARGLPREAMVDEHRATFDAIAPGFIAWIEANTSAGHVH